MGLVVLCGGGGGIRGVIEGMSMEPMEGGAGSPVGWGGGGSLKACPWKVGLLVLRVCWGGGVIEGMSMELVEGGAGDFSVCARGEGPH